MNRHLPLSLRLLLLAGLMIAVPACGKKGPPLPPLRPAPDKVSSIAIVRRDADVTISFLTPVRNGDGSLPFVLDRVEIYALTVPAGALTPTMKKVFVPANRIAVLGQRPPAPPKPATPADATKPASAEDAPPAIPLTFTEKTTIPPPVAVRPPPLPKKIVLAPLPITVGQIPDVTTPLPAAAASTAQTPLPSPTRFYLIVPYANRTRIGSTDMFGVSLVGAPGAPTNAAVKYDEQTITLSWTPAGAGQTVQVYDASSTAAAAGKPLNPAPLTVAEFKKPVVFGTEVCFVVRGVNGSAPVFFESAPSNKVCETPRDTFPPPAPTGLSAFASEGSIALTWEAVTASDLAGYIVLRSNGTSETLQPLSETPVTGTTFTDSTARPGVKYTYAVVAVDNAKPGNRSKESNRVEETGR